MLIKKLKQFSILSSLVLALSLTLSFFFIAVPNKATACVAGQFEIVNSTSNPKACCPSSKYNQSATTCMFGVYINPIINILSALVGVAVVIAIIVGGLQYSAAGSDPAKVGAAKKRITDAIIALLGFLLLYGILQWLIPGGLI